MKPIGLALLLAGWLASASVALGADRTAAQILREIDAVKVTAADSSIKEKSAVRDQEIRAKEALFKRARLIAELYKVAPDNQRVPALLEERWTTLRDHPENGRYAELLQELERIVARSPNKKLKTEAGYALARLKLKPISSKKEPDTSGVEQFLKLAPNDPRAGELLSSAITVAQDSKIRSKFLARLTKAFPDSDLPGMLEESHDQKEAIGKPFHLEFSNATTDSTVAMKKLKGKVVVIDFWATWCGPCVAEMPHMKELYGKYHDQGVEFIGVSLDQPEKEGGLVDLKKFVKEHSIKWPQYYQGNGWGSAFSKSWGIDSIPRVFVVDAAGKLFSVDARGKLDKMIPELLGKKTGAKTDTASNP
jgi:thiol-disulfide isomerase/thioredoxin